MPSEKIPPLDEQEHEQNKSSKVKPYTISYNLDDLELPPMLANWRVEDKDLATYLTNLTKQEK